MGSKVNLVLETWDHLKVHRDPSGQPHVSSHYRLVKTLDDWTDLLPLLDPLVHKLREGFPMDESAVSWRHLQLALLVDHLAPGDRDYGHAVALHALEDVVVHCLVVGLG